METRLILAYGIILFMTIGFGAALFHATRGLRASRRSRKRSARARQRLRLERSGNAA